MTNIVVCDDVDGAFENSGELARARTAATVMVYDQPAQMSVLKVRQWLGEMNCRGILYCAEPVKQLCHRCKSEKSPLIRARRDESPLTKGDYSGI